MKIIVSIILVLGTLVGFIALWGSQLPVGHVASRVQRLNRSRTEVWTIITDFANQASWRSDIKAVRRKEGAARETWIEQGSNGDMPLETTETDPPRRLVRTIADPSLPFGGKWIYELAEDGAGTRLTITEEGEVYNPIFRFVSYYVMNQAGTIEGYMKALAGHFKEEVRISESG